MKKICAVCGRQFECYNKTSNGKIKRPHRCKTCSHKCSLEYIDECRKEYRKRRKRNEKK